MCVSRFRDQKEFKDKQKEFKRRLKQKKVY
jgi:hypothetical protein